MPVHDWTRVDDGIFHDFHAGWIPEIRTALNGGLLPEGYYALAEQHVGRKIADVLTLHIQPRHIEPSHQFQPTAGTALADAPPRVRFEGSLAARQRSLAIRHVSGHRLVALLEIVSPGNKARELNIEVFADKIAEALDAGVNVVVIDLLPPGSFDRQGIHGYIRQRLFDPAEIYNLPADEPLTLASYVGGETIETFVEPIGVGGVLAEMPLFLSAERYINLPLESTYAAAYHGMPAFWRNVIEGKPLPSE